MSVQHASKNYVKRAESHSTFSKAYKTALSSLEKNIRINDYLMICTRLNHMYVQQCLPAFGHCQVTRDVAILNQETVQTVGLFQGKSIVFTIRKEMNN